MDDQEPGQEASPNKILEQKFKNPRLEALAREVEADNKFMRPLSAASVASEAMRLNTMYGTNALVYHVSMMEDDATVDDVADRIEGIWRNGVFANRDHNTVSDDFVTNQYVRGVLAERIMDVIVVMKPSSEDIQWRFSTQSHARWGSIRRKIKIEKMPPLKILEGDPPWVDEHGFIRQISPEAVIGFYISDTMARTV